LTEEELTGLLFKDAVPAGVSIHPVRDGDVTVDWQVRGLQLEDIQSFSDDLVYLLASNTRLQPQAEYEAERATRELAWNQSLDHVIGELKASPRQLFKELGDGAHMVNDNFVWIGVRDGARIIQWHPQSTEVFNKDIQYYLDRGLDLNESIETFGRQWDLLSKQMLNAFALTVAGAGSSGSLAKASSSILENALVAARSAIDLYAELKLPDTAPVEEVPIPGDEALAADTGTAGLDMARVAAGPDGGAGIPGAIGGDPGISLPGDDDGGISLPGDEDAGASVSNVAGANTRPGMDDAGISLPADDDAGKGLPVDHDAGICLPSNDAAATSPLDDDAGIGPPDNDDAVTFPSDGSESAPQGDTAAGGT
jgi:hypothetical protein